MDRFFSRLPNLETILWILASIAAFLALLIFIPSFFTLPTPTSVASAPPTVRATLTLLPSATSSPLPAAAARAQTPIPFPTESANGKSFSFPSEPRRSGWFASGDADIHFGDRNLHAGSFKGQTYQSIISFDMPTLAPGTKILYARVELTGLNRNNLGSSGSWNLQILPPSAGKLGVDLRTLPAQGNVGASLASSQLSEAQSNSFVFSSNLLTRIEESLDTDGRIFFRLTGPTGSGDNLFTWDGGDKDFQAAQPVLRLIATPGQYTVITNTPTAENVVTLAAVLFKNTEIAKRGTATFLPRVYATATPQVIITSLPTPANLETVGALSAYATAVAFTTGTFTPTPLNWITATPVPLIVPFATPTPIATSTPQLTRLELTRKPFPPGLLGKILFLSGPREKPTVLIMDAFGKNLGQFNDREAYDIAAARDAFSPSGIIEAFNAPDQNGTLQIFTFDNSIPGVPTQPLYNQLTFLRRGVAFAPAWSPDSKKIAYTNTENASHEIYVIDTETKRQTRLTNTKDWYWNQFPSWSPDGKQIVYASDGARAGAFTEIWVMNADGTGAYRLLDIGRDAWAPIWIKWNK